MHFFLSTCPSPSERRRQSPNGSPPPARVRDRRGRRGIEGEECGGVSAGGMAVTPPGRRRAFRVHSPTTPPDAPERGAQAADTRSDENRSPGGLSGVSKRPSHPRRRRIRDRAGEARYSSADPASGRESGPSGCDVAAYPTNRPAGPCRPADTGRARLLHPVVAARSPSTPLNECTNARMNE